jgi:hypothetical protein
MGAEICPRHAWRTNLAAASDVTPAMFLSVQSSSGLASHARANTASSAIPSVVRKISNARLCPGFQCVPILARPGLCHQSRPLPSVAGRQCAAQCASTSRRPVPEKALRAKRAPSGAGRLCAIASADGGYAASATSAARFARAAHALGRQNRAAASEALGRGRQFTPTNTHPLPGFQCVPITGPSICRRNPSRQPTAQRRTRLRSLRSRLLASISAPCNKITGWGQPISGPSCPTLLDRNQ